MMKFWGNPYEPEPPSSSAGSGLLYVTRASSVFFLRAFQFSRGNDKNSMMPPQQEREKAEEKTQLHNGDDAKRQGPWRGRGLFREMSGQIERKNAGVPKRTELGTGPISWLGSLAHTRFETHFESRDGWDINYGILIHTL